MSVAILPVSFCGTQAAVNTLRAGNDGPAPIPINARNAIKIINALCSPAKIVEKYFILTINAHGTEPNFYVPYL